MSRYPRATWRPLPEADTQPTMTPTQLISHSIVGSAGSAFNYFYSGTNLESHFILPKSGAPWQLIDTGHTADANLTANVRAISCETEDNGHPDTDPWTDSQLEELALLHVWAVGEHHLPARICPSPDVGGFGYHTIFGAPGPWTNVSGKTCPGAIRIKQWREVLIPDVLRRLVSPAPDTSPLTIPEDGMVIYRQTFGSHYWFQLVAGKLLSLIGAEFVTSGAAPTFVDVGPLQWERLVKITGQPVA